MHAKSRNLYQPDRRPAGSTPGPAGRFFRMNARLLVAAIPALFFTLSATAAVPASFAAVDRAAREAFEQQHIPGMGLSIYDSHDNKVFEQMYGDFSPDQRIPIASASKLVA